MIARRNTHRPGAAWIAAVGVLGVGLACGSGSNDSPPGRQGHAGAGGASDGGTASGGDTGGGTGGAASGTGATSSDTGGASAGPMCTDGRVVLAQSQATSACGFEVPEGADTSGLQVAIAISGQDRVVCRRTSSQGCSPEGWWLNGGYILLCDETCSTFNDLPDRQLVALLGCETTTCP